MTSVAVMMSVYNGEAYLPEQIDSILAQRDVEVTLYIRDDGSDAPARRMMDDFAKAHDNIVVDHGQNLGIKNSFLQLVKDVPLEHELFAFSDADDVWLPGKLAAAKGVLGDSGNRPSAYCSQVTLVDAQLATIGPGHPLRRPIDFSNAVVQCRMSGATAVFNRPLMELAKRYDHRNAVMHDAWMNLLAAAFGSVHFDETSHILYRQHGNNADGGGHGLRRRWQERLRRRAEFARYVDQAEALAMQAGDLLDEKSRTTIERLVEYRDKRRSGVAFLRDPAIRYQRLSSKLLTAFAI